MKSACFQGLHIISVCSLTCSCDGALRIPMVKGEKGALQAGEHISEQYALDWIYSVLLYISWSVTLSPSKKTSSKIGSE